MSRPPITDRRFRLIFFSCWIAWGVIHGYILGALGLSLKAAALDSAVTNALLCFTALRLSQTLGYYRPKVSRFYVLLVWGLVSVAVCTWLDQLLLAYWLKNEPGYRGFLQKSIPTRFSVGLLLDGFTALVSMLWYNQEELRENEKRSSQAEKLAREAELYNLRQQLQPHFLFNSLNSISALVGVHPEQARKMIQQLSDFLRGSIKKDEQSWVTLFEEMQYLQLYLDIEKVRFGHRLYTEIDWNPGEGKELFIPSLLLQPIVENAIKFGLYDTTEAVTIRISARAVEKELRIQVTNPFDPETSAPRTGTGFGLNSVQRRLYLLFGRNDLLQTEASGPLFSTTIKIPQIHDQSDPH